jgi:hypothetical protein
MRTDWEAFGIGSDNLPTGIPLTAWGCRIPMHDTPNIATVVMLHAAVRAVRLYVPDESIRYALDADPVPIGQAIQTPVDWSSFRLGDTVIPGQWQVCILPWDSVAHTLHMISQGSGILVTVIALTEGL